MAVYEIVEDYNNNDIVGVTKDGTVVFVCEQEYFFMNDLYILAHASDNDMIKPDNDIGIITLAEYKEIVSDRFEKLKE